MEIDIEVHSVDDWEAVYVDGEIYHQHHGCGHIERVILEHFGKSETPLTFKSYRDVQHENDEVDVYVQRTGFFPKKLSDVHALENPFVD